MVGVWWAIGFIAFFPTLISCGLRGKIFTVKQFTIFSGVFIMSIFNKCFLGPPRCYDIKILQLLLVNKHLPLILEQSKVFFCLFVLQFLLTCAWLFQKTGLMHIILLSARQFINRRLAVQEASHQKMADGSTPMDGGAWQAAVHGVAKSRTQLSQRLHFHVSLSCIGEGNGNPLQCSCLENPRDGEPGRLPSMGSHRAGLKWLSSSSSSIHNVRWKTTAY